MPPSTSHTIAAEAPISKPSGFLRPGDVLWVEEGSFTLFESPKTIVQSDDAASVTGALHEVERWVNQGYTAVGGLSFEAAPAFDPAFQSYEAAEVPALWFGVYSEGRKISLPVKSDSGFVPPVWESSIHQSQFEGRLKTIKDYIEAGDTYQVNFTFPLYSNRMANPLAWALSRLVHSKVRYGGILHLGSHLVVSLSPELFFQLDGQRLVTCPMKGTAPRGRFAAEDEANRINLQHSDKDRAENIMIVDLLRNDMGKISETGSVEVLSTFDVNPFDAVWQMTSTIQSKTSASVPEIFAALFPSGSVTGAPKIRSMEIIHELESRPRGIYCGSIGCWKPERNAVFNVAIRTATVDLQSSTGVYPVGAGITWGSEVGSEYRECLMKAKVLDIRKPEFGLFESLLWDGNYFLLGRHLDRLKRSAAHFGFPYDRANLVRELENHVSEFENDPRKVRLVLTRHGDITVDSDLVFPFSANRVGIARQPVDNTAIYLFHKTTNREIYDEAKVDWDGYDDVLLWNQNGELTESTRANVVVQIDGVKYTPPISCGLLAGTFREELVESGQLIERVIQKEELTTAEKIWCINSVRKWIEIEIVFPHIVAGEIGEE
jgi:para-aminobenzoate synthetase/4-amino-4-deoxychorismate lyase